MGENDSSVEYRDIQGLSGYRVGNDGSVWTLWIRRQRKLGSVWNRMIPGTDRYGYFRVVLHDGDKIYHRTVHQLVLEAFEGPKPAGHEGRHLDSDRSNNRADNLKWGTRLENATDAVLQGRYRYGESNGRSKLTHDDVEQIKQLRRAGVTAEDIALQFRVSAKHVRGIVAGRDRNSRTQRIKEGIDQ
jgi:hypothetical protein